MWLAHRPDITMHWLAICWFRLWGCPVYHWSPTVSLLVVRFIYICQLPIGDRLYLEVSLNPRFRLRVPCEPSQCIVKGRVGFLIGHVNIGIIFFVLEIPTDAYTTLSRNLIGCSRLGQEYCKLIGWYLKIMRRQLWTLTCPIEFIRQIL